MDINDQILQEADTIKSYIRKYLDNSITDMESALLSEWVHASPENKAFFEKITASGELDEQLERYKTELEYIQEAGIITGFNARFESEPALQKKKANRLLWIMGLSATAAACMLFLIANFYLQYDTSKKTAINIIAAQDTNSTISPGKTGAILVLSDGTEVLLDTVWSKKITEENGAVVQVTNGAVSYPKTLHQQEDTIWNTVKTPVGRQFKVILADNSVVWLNASSAITYPTNFSGTTRNIKIKGEVYLEVTPNPKQPFFVTINDQAMVEVLGTSFNINAYPDEPRITTTLVEGSVKLLALNNEKKPVNEKAFLILKPNQQGIVNFKEGQSNGGSKKYILSLKDDVNTGKITAWKNGLFDFQDTNLEEVMKQLARWYNLDVVYENGIPDIEFYGKMDRGLTWSEVQRFLTELNVKFRMEKDRRVIVSN